MSTVRLAIASIVDAHRSAGLESPVNAGVSETLRGLARQIGVNQKQAKPLDAVQARLSINLSTTLSVSKRLVASPSGLNRRRLKRT